MAVRDADYCRWLRAQDWLGEDLYEEISWALIDADEPLTDPDPEPDLFDDP